MQTQIQKSIAIVIAIISSQLLNAQVKTKTFSNGIPTSAITSSKSIPNIISLYAPTEFQSLKSAKHAKIDDQFAVSLPTEIDFFAKATKLRMDLAN